MSIKQVVKNENPATQPKYSISNYIHTRYLFLWENFVTSGVCQNVPVCNEIVSAEMFPFSWNGNNWTKTKRKKTPENKTKQWNIPLCTKLLIYFKKEKITTSLLKKCSRSISKWISNNLNKNNAQHYIVFENISDDPFKCFKQIYVLTKKLDKIHAYGGK